MTIQISLILTTILIQILFYSCINKKSKNLYWISGCIFSSIVTISCFYLTYLFINQNSHFLTLEIGILALNIEPLTLVFLCMLSTLWFITNLYSGGYLYANPQINIRKFNICTSGSILSTIMIALSSNLIMTFAFYELLTLFTYPLIVNTNTKTEKDAGRFYLYFLIATSSMILFPLILFLGVNFETVNFKIGGILSSGSCLIPLLILSLYGVSKAAILPVHFWLPKAMVAPIPVSAILHAVAVVKSGIFILLKMYIYIFGIEMLKDIPSWNGVNIITILCGISLILSSIIALYQTTFKRLLAYSTINQLSICILAASLFNIVGITSSILHMLSHAFTKITLFFAVGYIYCNFNITNISDINGIAKKLPLTAFLFCIGAFSIIGIPPFGGFISKAYIIYAAFSDPIPNYFVIAIMIISILLTTQYFGIIMYKLYFQRVKISSKITEIKEIKSSMVHATIASAALTSGYILIYPYLMLLLERIQY